MIQVLRSMFINLLTPVSETGDVCTARRSQNYRIACWNMQVVYNMSDTGNFSIDKWLF